MPARLLTIAPSHFCEKARWALDRAGWRYEEERHIPLLHWLATVPSTRRRQVPILITPHAAIGDYTAIVEFVDRSLAEPERLFPESPQRDEIKALTLELDRVLGPATRRYAYFFLLKSPQAMTATLSAGMGPVPRAIARALQKPLAVGLTRGLVLTPEATSRSKDRILRIFDEMDQRLATSSSKHLFGARMTAADLTFAALAAPVLLPPEYGSWLPPPEETPAEYASFVAELRDRPSGRFALRLFKDERRRVVSG